MANINEDSVGTLLPIEEPSEVLRKDATPSIDDAFNAIRLTDDEPDGSNEETNINESIGVDVAISTVSPVPLLWTCVAVVAIPIGVVATLEINARRRLQELENMYAVKDRKFIPLSNCEHRMFNLDYSAYNASKLAGKSNYSTEDIVKMRYGKEITKFKALQSNVNRVHELWFADELVVAFLIEAEQAHGTVTKNNLYIGLNKRYKKYADYQVAYIGFKYCKNESSLTMIKQLYTKENEKSFNEDGGDALSHAIPINVKSVNTMPTGGFRDLLKENGIQSVIAELENREDAMDVWGEEWEDEVYMEAAKIDDDIKDIIDILNEKGYTTVYSCSGHPSARLKSDKFKDGIKNGKLYSTARIVFDKNYKFGSIPKYWELKILDKGQTGIYVKGPTYNITNGMAPEQFARWKRRYMYNLEKWAKDLPKAGTDEKPDHEDFQESADSLLSVAEDVMLSALSDETNTQVYMEDTTADDEFSLQKEVFGKMKYHYGWKKPYRIKLFGKAYSTHIKVHSYYDTSPANNAQREAYKKFIKNIDRLMSAAEKALVSYGQKSVDSSITEKTTSKSIKKVDSILFDSNGSVVLLLQSDWEYEHGIGVQIIPSIKVGVQDMFL